MYDFVALLMCIIMPFIAWRAMRALERLADAAEKNAERPQP